MRERLIRVLCAVAVLVALLPSGPASATHAVVSISFPGDVSEFYSPFEGPATITIDVDPDDVDSTFNVRLRPTGGTAIQTKAYFVDNGGSDPRVLTFAWEPLSVANATQYDVAVYRDGGLVAVESFFLHPRLARIVGIAPDPFFPKIDDGHKDVAHVTFSLEADVVAAEARVFAARSSGACCAGLVRSESLGSQSAGTNVWDWDGKNGGGTNLPKGAYYVRIWADDGVFAPSLSKPSKVSIARTYRATATKSKLGKNYHHVGPSSSIVLGGGCLTNVNGDAVSILCQGGKITVYWRWGLGPNESIVGQSFELSSSPADCPSSIRSTGHTKHESRFTETEGLPDFRGLCTIEVAKITYSYLVSS
jgi:hypothetical protein